MIKRYFCVYDPEEQHKGTSFQYSRLIEATFFKESMPCSTFVSRRLLGIDAFLIEAKYISDGLHSDS